MSNVYLNAKVEQYQYNFDYLQRAEIAGLPIVPSIGLRGELSPAARSSSSARWR